MISVIEHANQDSGAFRKTSSLFAIRNLFGEIPGCVDSIFTPDFCRYIRQLLGGDYFIVKSIYFDKPSNSNWFVAYHQDLSISINRQLLIPGFNNWTIKQGRYAVQPTAEILEHNITIRIHLDDTDEGNGALKVIKGSHLRGICRQEEVIDHKEKEISCNVKRGGIMLMKPLLMHASGRSTHERRRRVIHIEFSNQILPEGLAWAEYLPLPDN